MTNKQLIKLWVTGCPTTEIAKKANISIQTVYTRISKLRKKGVNLPQRDRTVARREPTVEELNKYIKQLLG